MKDELLSDEDAKEELAACLTPPSLRATTRSINYVLWNSEWDDKNDQWGELRPELLRFIDEAPSIVIASQKVGGILASRYDTLVERLRKEINMLRGDQSKMKEEIKRQQKKLAKAAKTGRYSPFVIFMTLIFYFSPLPQSIWNSK